MRINKALVLGFGLAVLAGGQAMAACSTYTAGNGAETFPGTYVGTVSALGVCQIGTGHSNTGTTLISPSANPSIYEFYFDGGALSITESVGNNGTLTSGWDVELLSLATQSSTSGTVLASINIPYSSAPSGPFSLVTGMNLGAGYYSVSNFIGNISTDPQYQLNFAFPAGTGGIPEPAAWALMVLGFGSVGALMRNRRRTTQLGLA
ncbi:PEPxxWA-CTERM sorting domain-containing protein [Phenylobacterium sp.]|uniref:PEPxxWA-CTERM sorting domain-containing protein n=1 Tax=Phenylobacterium sp. TaxID=1871053 RepID=UPI0035643213